MTFYRYYVGCSDTIASVTLTHGVNSVTLDVFGSSEGFSRTASLEQAGYKVYASTIPYKYQLDVRMTEAQRNALETVFAASQTAWGSDSDGSITVTETIRNTPSGKYLLDELNIRESGGGDYRFVASLTLEKWAQTTDTGIKNFAIGGVNYCRFATYERPTITSVVAERGPAGAVLVKGISYTVPIVWNLGLALTAAERTALKSTLTNSNSTYALGSDGKITISDGIGGGGTLYAVMNNYSERSDKLGRWNVSFVLTQV